VASKSPKKGVVDQADLSSAITPSATSDAPSGERLPLKERQRLAKQAQRERDKAEKEAGGGADVSAPPAAKGKGGPKPKVRASKEQLGTARKVRDERKNTAAIGIDMSAKAVEGRRARRKSSRPNTRLPDREPTTPRSVEVESMRVRGSGLQPSEIDPSSDQVGEPAAPKSVMESSRRRLQRRRHYKVGMGPSEGAPGTDWRQVNAPNTSYRMLTPDVTGPSESKLQASGGTLKAVSDPAYATISGQNRRSHFLLGRVALDDKAINTMRDWVRPDSPTKQKFTNEDIAGSAAASTTKAVANELMSAPPGSRKARPVLKHEPSSGIQRSVYDAKTKKWSKQDIRPGLREVRKSDAGEVISTSTKEMPYSKFGETRLKEIADKTGTAPKANPGKVKPTKGFMKDEMPGVSLEERTHRAALASAAAGVNRSSDLSSEHRQILAQIKSDANEIVKINSGVNVTRDSLGRAVTEGEVDLSPASDEAPSRMDLRAREDVEILRHTPEESKAIKSGKRTKRQRFADIEATRKYARSQQNPEISETAQDLAALQSGMSTRAISNTQRSVGKINSDVQAAQDKNRVIRYTVNQYEARPQPEYQTRIQQARARVDAEYAAKHAEARKAGEASRKAGVKALSTKAFNDKFKDVHIPTQEEAAKAAASMNSASYTTRPRKKGDSMYNPPAVKLRKASPQFTAQYQAASVKPPTDMRHLGAAPDRPASSLDPITPGSNRWEKNKVQVSVESMHNPVRFRTPEEFAANESMNRAYTRQERAAAEMSSPAQPSSFKKVKGAKVNPQNMASAATAPTRDAGAVKAAGASVTPAQKESNIAKAESLQKTGSRAGYRSEYNPRTGVTRRFGSDGKEIK